MSQNSKTVLGLIVMMSAMGSIPYITRVSQEKTFVEKEKLTGSQRQRGMNLMAGTHDAGIEPNWDSKTGTYRAYKKPPPVQ